MNIKVTYNWLLEHLETDADPYEIQKYLSMCGPSIERVEKIDGDYVFDVEITSNRIDTASVIGIAREASAILPMFNIKADLIKTKPQIVSAPKINDYDLKIIDSQKHTRRVMAVVLDQLAVKPSPDIIQKRLVACGIRSLSNIIDITNYVMLEVGHPVHVFDFDLIKTNTLAFRYAKNGEKLITLDGKIQTLDDKDIIIDDGNGRIIDLPGIMGAENTSVTAETKRAVVFIESNTPQNIRRTSMRLGLRSLAASYNEKNPDPELISTAFTHAVALFKQHALARVASEIYDYYPNKRQPITISFLLQDINDKIGFEIERKEVLKILTALGFKPSQKGEDKITITIPTSRVDDISTTVDVVEEVARIYGYYKMPSKIQMTEVVHGDKKLDRYFIAESKIKTFLKHNGYHEVYNYSLLSKKLLEDLDQNINSHLRLQNPISSDIEYLRTSLLGSLLQNIRDNQGKRDELNFFEIAKVYSKNNNSLPNESRRLSIASTDSFTRLKGTTESLINELNIDDIKFKICKDNFLFSDLQTSIIHNGAGILGYIGEISNKYITKLGIKKSITVVDFDFELLTSLYKIIPIYNPIIPFATIKLDININFNRNHSYQDTTDLIKKMSPLVTKVEFISVYKNKLTLRIYFQHKNRNLTENETKLELANIERAFKKNYGDGDDC